MVTPFCRRCATADEENLRWRDMQPLLRLLYCVLHSLRDSADWLSGHCAQATMQRERVGQLPIQHACNQKLISVIRSMPRTLSYFALRFPRKPPTLSRSFVHSRPPLFKMRKADGNLKEMKDLLKFKRCSPSGGIDFLLSANIRS